VRTEPPQVYFRALVKLTAALHRALGKPNNFDRRRFREEASRRLESVSKEATDQPLG